MRLSIVTSRVCAALLVLYMAGAGAKEAVPMAEDPLLEARVMAVAEELRCLVCQNQTIADSHADLAIDLKNQVREMLVAGKSEQEIIDYMVQRYGDFVRYRPPVNPSTYLLWFGPFALFILGGGVLIYNLRRRRQQVEDTPLSEADHKRAEELLKQVPGENQE